MRKLIFIDRDGVINKKAKNNDYIKSWNEFIWNNKIGEFIKYCNFNKYYVVVVTNQQGIGKGLFTIKELKNIHKKINFNLKQINAKVDKFYYCTHLVSDNCSCRKPKIGMLEKACSELNFFDKNNMIMIGDSDTDIECAKNFRIKNFKIETDNFAKYYNTIIDFIK